VGTAANHRLAPPRAHYRKREFGLVRSILTFPAKSGNFVTLATLPLCSGTSPGPLPGASGVTVQKPAQSPPSRAFC
jgi:hypothetical protein